MTTEAYFKQTKLMLQVLAYVAKEPCFALKGGTAINLFVQDMPRLSVDIDLAYLPMEGREESLENIGTALDRISKALGSAYSVRSVKSDYLLGFETKKYTKKLSVASGSVVVTIEPNTVFRGTVFPSEERHLVQVAQDKFEMFVSVVSLTEADLYGGKFCAALDRQHPRDLFDVMMLLKEEKIPEKVRKAFVVYLAGHPRPINELLNPNFKDIQRDYENNFRGMTEAVVSYEELIVWQKKLPQLIRKQLTKNEINFLISLKEGRPQWTLMGIDGIETLPALQWKVKNIQKMNAEKRLDQLQKLRSIFK